jgi:predicted methyltransferase
LLLGDDDLVSIALRQAGGPVPRVVDIDTALLDYLGRLEIDAHFHDLANPLPPQYVEAFDVVALDPPWAVVGMRYFLERARQSVVPGGTVFLVTCTDFLESAAEYHADVARLGFSLRQTIPNMNRYPFPLQLRQEGLAFLSRADLPAEVAECLLSVPFLYADTYIYSG